MSPMHLLRRAASVAAVCAVAATIVFAVPVARADGDAKPGGIPADTEIKTTPSGLKYSVLVAGKDGKHPKTGEKVKVHYTGWLLDGTKFDSSRDRGAPTEFTVGQVIQGWNEALELMTVGARWKLTIPPALGYGARGMPPTIPADATLIFDVELLDFQSMPEFHAPDPAAQKKTASGLKYEVVSAGAGDPPAPDDAFELKYAFWNAKSELLDCTEKTGTSLKMRRADLPPLAFLKEAVDLLRPGARLRFEVPPELCFGDKAQGPQLPPNSTTIWELEMVRVMKPLPVPPFAMPEDAKLKTTASGLKYEVIEEGDGVSPKMGETVKVHYAGWLTDGTLFDSSFQRGEPMDMRLGMVIRGWNEGLQLMKPGAVYKFVIPPQLAYGPRGAPPKIPANATLVFYIKLIKVGS